MSNDNLFEKPWIEKYRPETLSDVVGNLNIVSQLRVISQEGNIPNLILAGPPGTGKTTSVMALAHQLLGDNFKRAVIELNASDERGIDVVRDKIKAFANQKINLPEKRHKIIILDEADSMTESAQQALRVIISDYSATTRFALACNDSSKIIEPIQSRCCVLRFMKLQEKDIKERLVKIIEFEHIPYEEQGLRDIVDTCDGDMRYAINNLQSTFIGFEKITHENVYKIIDIPKPEEFQKIIDACEGQEFKAAASNVDKLYDNGYSSMDILSVCSKIIKANDKLPLQPKFSMIKCLTKYKLRFLDGIDSAVQMYSFISEIIELFKEAKKEGYKSDIMDIC